MLSIYSLFSSNKQNFEREFDTLSIAIKYFLEDGRSVDAADLALAQSLESILDVMQSVREYFSPTGYNDIK
jgi:hypothetical protein